MDYLLVTSFIDPVSTVGSSTLFELNSKFSLFPYSIPSIVYIS